MRKPVHPAAERASAWALMLLFASSGFALAAAALLSAEFVPIW